ncbi:MAG: hypothetical protein HPY90_10215 [Syntrophothermus sp.]|uniref:hypothetical protein n=1 Tax=Syntrophothermus sp. TaxID=2736299 RepID=UPI00257B7A59|nr:hypothetical protein [Syntrophothermus sp.]NSW83626.1 hypothetical protein [Syntrophothermus sp.]
MEHIKFSSDIIPTPEYMAKEVKKGKCVTIKLTPEMQEMLNRYWESRLPKSQMELKHRRKQALGEDE